MSYLALATDNFEAVARFYCQSLGFRKLEAWDRPDARGIRLDACGLRLEVFDAAREERPLTLRPADDRLHIVVEVADVDATHRELPIDAPPPVTTSWGARMFQVRDPDGVSVCFLQWLKRQA